MLHASHPWCLGWTTRLGGKATAGTAHGRVPDFIAKRQASGPLLDSKAADPPLLEQRVFRDLGHDPFRDHWSWVSLEVECTRRLAQLRYKAVHTQIKHVHQPKPLKIEAF